MAYSFDTIQNLMGDDEQQQQSQGLTTEGGGVAGTTSTGEAMAAPEAPQQQQQPAATRGTIMDRHRDRVGAPVDLGGMQQAIGTAGSQLRQEADAYVNQAAQSYDHIDDPTIQQSLSQYAQTGQFNDVLAALGERQHIQPFEASFQPEIPDAHLIGSDAGLRELFRRQADAEYRPGEAALDAALLGENVGFQQHRDDTLRDFQGLQGLQADIRGNIQTDAQQAYDASRAGFEQRVSDTAAQRYDDMYRSMRDHGNWQIQQAHQLRHRLHQDMLRDGPEKVLNDLKKQAVDPEVIESLRRAWSQDFGRGGTSQMRDYVRDDGMDLHYSDFLDDRGAQQFNRIQSLINPQITRNVPMVMDQMQGGRFAGQSLQDVAGQGLKFDDSALRTDLLGSGSRQYESMMQEQARQQEARAEAQRQFEEKQELERSAMAEQARLEQIERDKDTVQRRRIEQEALGGR